MGWNSPRYSTGDRGFMSHVSNWLGPPKRKIMMHDFARAGRSKAAPRPSFRISAESPSPSDPKPIRRSNWRRVRCSTDEHSAGRYLIVEPLVCDFIVRLPQSTLCPMADQFPAGIRFRVTSFYTSSCVHWVRKRMRGENLQLLLKDLAAKLIEAGQQGASNMNKRIIRVINASERHKK